MANYNLVNVSQRIGSAVELGLPRVRKYVNSVCTAHFVLHKKSHATMEDAMAFLFLVLSVFLSFFLAWCGFWLPFLAGLPRGEEQSFYYLHGLLISDWRDSVGDVDNFTRMYSVQSKLQSTEYLCLVVFVAIVRRRGESHPPSRQRKNWSAHH